MTDLETKRIWTCLTQSEKEDACLAFWQGGDSLTREMQPRVLHDLAGALRFREIFVKRMPAAEKARHLRRLVDGPALRYYGEDLVRSWLVVRKGPMIVCFVETQGMAHTDGILHDDVPQPTVESLRKGLQAIKERFPARDVALYMAVMLSTAGEFWAGLAEAVKAELPTLEETLAAPAG